MKYCEHCKVYIRDEKNKCALCYNPIKDKGYGNHEKIFPDIPPFYERHTAIRILVFISIVAIVLSFAINIVFPSSINWPVLFLFALLSIWLDLIFLIQKRYHIPKKIIWQVIIVSLLSLFWDWRTGWRGWSIDYVVPIACVSAMAIMYITARIMNLSAGDYLTYILIDSLFGIIPFIFIVSGWVKVIYPSIISIVASIISLSAIFIFQGEDIKAEISKRMHV